MIQSLIIGVSIVGTGFLISRAIRRQTEVMFEAILRNALISNFSRFGDLDEYRIAVIDDDKGYFVRDGALWVCEVQDEEVIRSTARPVDLFTANEEQVKRALAAVDVLHADLHEHDTED